MVEGVDINNIGGNTIWRWECGVVVGWGRGKFGEIIL